MNEGKLERFIKITAIYVNPINYQDSLKGWTAEKLKMIKEEVGYDETIAVLFSNGIGVMSDAKRYEYIKMEASFKDDEKAEAVKGLICLMARKFSGRLDCKRVEIYCTTFNAEKYVY